MLLKAQNFFSSSENSIQTRLLDKQGNSKQSFSWTKPHSGGVRWLSRTQKPAAQNSALGLIALFALDSGYLLCFGFAIWWCLWVSPLLRFQIAATRTSRTSIERARKRGSVLFVRANNNNNKTSLLSSAKRTESHEQFLHALSLSLSLSLSLAFSQFACKASEKSEQAKASRQSKERAQRGRREQTNEWFLTINTNNYYFFLMLLSASTSNTIYKETQN